MKVFADGDTLSRTSRSCIELADAHLVDVAADWQAGAARLTTPLESFWTGGEL